MEPYGVAVISAVLADIMRRATILIVTVTYIPILTLWLTII
ncbi:hypothetical protein ASZ90_004462 [hydrocarbon metagenome]|uniref:Uncharacterized protein n=1 Tax=hydrocarbon metagenome TaxID=938273 RepID=A0A0W8FXR4_9ZZZZ